MMLHLVVTYYRKNLSKIKLQFIYFLTKKQYTMTNCFVMYGNVISNVIFNV